VVPAREGLLAAIGLQPSYWYVAFGPLFLLVFSFGNEVDDNTNNALSIQKFPTFLFACKMHECTATTFPGARWPRFKAPLRLPNWLTQRQNKQIIVPSRSLQFLKAPRAGGRTVFPNAALTQQRLEAANQEDANDGGDSWYCKTEQVLGVSPSPGDAILFWDYRPGNGAGIGSYENGTAEPSARPVVGSLHSGCPVLDGEKWIATRWIRASRFV
jgi:hypothetical protein